MGQASDARAVLKFSGWAGLGRACLDSVEVQVCPVGAGGNAGGGAAAHANSVGRPADLDDQHADARVLLVQVAVVYLAQAATAQACGRLR